MINFLITTLRKRKRSAKYSIIIPGEGTGPVNIIHPLDTSEVIVSLQRIKSTSGKPLGEVLSTWHAVDDNTISFDFGTYNRNKDEFKAVFVG